MALAQGFSRERQFTWRAFFVCFFVSIGVLSFGYPTAITGTTLSQPSFLHYMHLVDENGNPSDGSESLVGALSGVYQAGAVVGIMLGIFIMDKYGRKWCLAYASTLGILGAAGCCGARNIGMFIAFRFFAGAGAWATLCVSPVYISELAPPKVRGLFVGLTGVILMLGQAMASYMGLAFYTVGAKDNAQWRGPMGIQIVFPAVTLAIVYWLPESPRWSLMNNKTNAAKEVILGLHGGSIAEQEFALAEFHQMSRQAEYDRTLDSSWKACFTKPSYRRRFEICCLYGAITQSTGLLVITSYGSVLYRTLGYGAREQIMFQCGYISVAVVFNILGILVVDMTGRKILMLVGLTSCAIWMSVETAMVAQFASPVPENPDKAGLAVGVAALYLWIAFYAPTIDTAGFVYYSEVFPNHLRAKGVSAAICSAALTDILYLQVASTAFADIGWKYFLVFIIIPILGVFYIWFRYPETNRIPLEEVARRFGDSDEVMVFSEDIVIDHERHELTMRGHKLGSDTGRADALIDEESKSVPPEAITHVEKARDDAGTIDSGSSGKIQGRRSGHGLG